VREAEPPLPEARLARYDALIAGLREEMATKRPPPRRR
jgi:hypothetical protein